MSKHHETLIVQDGLVTSPDLHDARIVGVTCIDKVAVVFVRLTDGGKVRLIFTGVERLRVENFREGNIALTAELARGEEIRDGDIRFVFGLEDEPENSEILDRMSTKARKKNTVCVRIDCSYGAEIVCLSSDLHAALGWTMDVP